MSNFHGRLMNIAARAGQSSRLPGYYEGHRDARHAAAEIGNEADALAARLAEAERDAARYRWLREQNAILESNTFTVVLDDELGGTWIGADLDYAIDEARATDSAIPEESASAKPYTADNADVHRKPADSIQPTSDVYSADSDAVNTGPNLRTDSASPAQEGQ